ncbi:histidine kinase N-terminal domain-containing protein [Proteinivorax tanatarense]|uniref:histidine kinase n=1 Tax=Proteinivorax tanatarense TaxID=1260629 RepID=A0AAU7VK39_9FIRM
MLRKLCKTYTQLTEQDLDVLENIENVLPLISRANQGDVFIDCLTNVPNIAIVVGEARLDKGSSMYCQSVLGEFALRENEPAVLRTLQTGVPSRNLKGRTQENKRVRQIVEPIYNLKNQIIGVLIIEQNTIVANEDMGQLLNSSCLEKNNKDSFEFPQNTIIHHVKEAIVIFDKQGVATYCNSQAVELYKKMGYQDEIVGLSLHNLTLGTVDLNYPSEEEALTIREIRAGDLSLQVRYLRMDDQEKATGYIMIIDDITEVKKKEMELISKSVAISEIHHRVKNNLQTIASLLRLQSRRVEAENVKRAFEESINRILSITITHELLAQKGLDDVDLITILEKIRESVIGHAFSCEKSIDIHVRGEHVVVDSDKATSIALVVNELLQNSLKHGFEGRSSGEIVIEITKGTLCNDIKIRDNGVGFEKDQSGKETSLGLRIVKSIVQERLHGNFRIKKIQNGTEIRFSYKK